MTRVNSPGIVAPANRLGSPSELPTRVGSPDRSMDIDAPRGACQDRRPQEYASVTLPWSRDEDATSLER